MLDALAVITLALVVVTFTALVIAYLQWRENHADRGGRKLADTIKRIIRDENSAVNVTLHDHTLRLNRVEDTQKEIRTGLRSVVEGQAKMGVKVDMYWSTLESLAMNAAKGLHQPDPARARIDHLLEAFMEGTLTGDERIELKKILVQIRNYESGTNILDFPVHPGEQTAAAILLSTMDVVDPRRMAAMGHTAHRSIAHKEDKGA